MADSRNEAILQNILGDNNNILPPVSRIEVLLIRLLESISIGSSIIVLDDGNGNVTLNIREG